MFEVNTGPLTTVKQREGLLYALGAGVADGVFERDFFDVRPARADAEPCPAAELFAADTTPFELDADATITNHGATVTGSTNAGAAVFLASDTSSYITGQTIHADGATQASSGWYHHSGERRLRPGDHLVAIANMASAQHRRSELFVRRFGQNRRDRLRRDTETPQAEMLYARTDFGGISMGRRPVPFDVGPYDALDGQRLTVGIDVAE